MSAIPNAASSNSTGPPIAAAVRRAWDGAPWHGPSLAALLDGLTLAQVTARPVEGGPSIGTLVLHLAFWCETARRRAAGETCTVTEADNFPPPPATPGAWDDARARLAAALGAVASALDRLSPDDPGNPTDGVWSAPDLLLGAHEHVLYHSGQIALLRRALGVPVAS